MAVGNVRVLTYGQAQNGLTIPSSLASAQYVIILANVAANTDAAPAYTVTGDWITPISGRQSSASVNPPIAAGAMSAKFTSVGGLRGAYVESVIRDYERGLLSANETGTVRTSLLPSKASNVPASIDATRVYVIRTS
jgi:hypothetical protein